MLNKKILFIAAALFGVLSAYSTNLLDNGSFEEFKPSKVMSLESADFANWAFPNAWGKNVDSTDVVDGKVSFVTTKEHKSNATLYQTVDCSSYVTGEEFRMVVYFKDISQGDSLLTISSYWAASAGTEDPIETVTQVLPYSATWDSVEVRTTKPEGARNFEFRIAIKKNALVKLDNLKFEYVDPTVPFFTVLPDKRNYTFTSFLNSDTMVARLIIRQRNLTQPVQLLWSISTDKTKYSVSKSEVTAEEDTVEVKFKSSVQGKFDATLNIKDDESPKTSIMNTTISFNATVIDTTKSPIITITPLKFDTFRCKAYETVTDTFVVKSENCYDYVHVVVDDETGPDWAFGLSESFFLKNTIDTVIITFAPKKEGIYTARYKAYTTGVDTIFFSTAGVASDGKPEPIIVDWDTTFVFKTDNPYTIMDENFDHADTCRNKTLKTTDWQNVVTKGQRPWWGYYSDSTTQAKVVSYFSDQDSGSVAMETWLVTPALDYKNASPKTFTFSVMSDLIYKGQTGKLELHFIDPTDPQKIYFEHIQAVDTMIPANDSELEKSWVPIVMDLSKVPNMPDVFFMAFKFTDNGGNNGVVYYITNVTWGVYNPTGIQEVQNAECTMQNSKFIQNGRLYILKDGKRYNVLGQLQ